MKKILQGCTVNKVAWILVIIGALNWGLEGFGSMINWDLNIVNILLGNWMLLENMVYVLVGISALVVLYGCRCKTCDACGPSSSPSSTPH